MYSLIFVDTFITYRVKQRIYNVVYVFHCLWCHSTMHALFWLRTTLLKTSRLDLRKNKNIAKPHFSKNFIFEHYFAYWNKFLHASDLSVIITITDHPANHHHHHHNRSSSFSWINITTMDRYHHCWLSSLSLIIIDPQAQDIIVIIIDYHYCGSTSS